MSNTRRPAKQAAPAPFDWDAIVADPKRATTSVSLCFRPDLNGRHSELSAQLQAITEKMSKGGTDRRLGQADERAPIVAEIESLEAEMQAATRAVALEAMRPAEFRALIAAHPARKDEQLDAAYGVNVETAIPALLAECATEPKRDATYWATMLADVLNDRQYERLFIAVWNLNRADVVPGFSLLASVVTKRTNGSSPQPTD